MWLSTLLYGEFLQINKKNTAVRTGEQQELAVHKIRNKNGRDFPFLVRDIESGKKS